MVRPAHENDIPGIARIHVTSWQTAYKNLLPDDFLQALDPAKKESLWAKVLREEPGSLYVIESESAVVGFCHFTRSRFEPMSEAAEITSIYLQPSRCREGLGTRLISEIINIAADRFDLMILWVLESNVPARRFYEKLGFSVEGSHKTERGPGFELKEVLYQRSLG